MSSTGSFLSMILYAAAVVFPAAAPWLMAAAAAVSAVDAREDMRRAKNQARDAYNASLEDRLEMVDITADQARTIVLGRVRCVEGVRRRWSLGENKEKLTMIVSFAGHEIDGFEQWYFNDTPVTLDGSGNVITEPWKKVAREPLQIGGSLDSAGGATVTLPETYISGSTVRAVWASGTGTEASQGDCSVSVTGLTATISAGVPLAEYVLTYEAGAATYTARVRPYLGTAEQNIGGDLASEYPGELTGHDRGAHIACSVVDITYDADIYTQGRPNITAVLRGAKVYDPRLDSTQPGGSGAHRANDKTTWAFSENPALHALHYARHEWGWAVPIEEINVADVMAAATACDVSTVFTLRKPDNSTTTVTLPRYRCGIVIKTDADRRAAMDEIMKTMAGRHGWAGGKWRMRAGVMGASVFALDASWIAQRLNEDGEPASDDPVVRITNGVSRESRVTRVTGKCVNPEERYQALPFPAVQDAVLIAADGGIPMPLEVNFDGVNHSAQAQHLGTIFIRQAQAAMRMQASCNLSAFRCELFDVGTVTLDRFGMAAKPFEVLGWRWHPNDGVTLSLGEIDASIFTPVAELKGLDPAPNSNLPPPWQVHVISGLTVVSGTEELGDNRSVITRTRMSWAPITQQSVLAGGYVEVQYAEVVNGGSLAWASWAEAGSSTEATIPGLRSGVRYMFRARAIQQLPYVHGPWSTLVQAVPIVNVLAAPPAAPTGLSYATEPYGVRLSCARNAEFDVVGYEWRVGATWAGAAVLDKQAGTSYLWAVQATGTYTVWVAAVDALDNVSSPASMSVSVTTASLAALAASIVGSDLQLDYAAGAGSFAVAGYEVRHGASWAAGTVVGFFQVTRHTRRVDWGGARTWWVAAVDAKGNYGTPASVDVTITAPGVVTSTRSEVVDNNALLYWSAPVVGSLPVERYEVRKGANWAAGTVVGSNGNSTFTAIFEQAAGVFSYWVAAYDSAGNLGAQASIVATVSQPPDYILRTDWASAFAGTLTNMYVEAGALVGPVTSQDWATHYTANAWTTPQAQIDAGYPIYAQPSAGSGSYDETFDYGTALGATTVSATLGSSVVSGTVVVICQIYTKLLAGDAWTAAASGATSVLASNFRYVRVVWTFTPGSPTGLIRVNSFGLKLSNKLKTDSGSGTITNANAGLFVSFNVAFVDADTPIAQPTGTVPRIPVVDFTDVANPTGFTAYLYDMAGTKVTGSFSWTARGH